MYSSNDRQGGWWVRPVRQYSTTRTSRDGSRERDAHKETNRERSAGGASAGASRRQVKKRDSRLLSENPAARASLGRGGRYHRGGGRDRFEGTARCAPVDRRADRERAWRLARCVSVLHPARFPSRLSTARRRRGRRSDPNRDFAGGGHYRHPNDRSSRGALRGSAWFPARAQSRSRVRVVTSAIARRSAFARDADASSSSLPPRRPTRRRLATYRVVNGPDRGCMRAR